MHLVLRLEAAAVGEPRAVESDLMIFGQNDKHRLQPDLH